VICTGVALPVIRIAISGRIASKPVPVRAAVVEQSPQQLRERQRDDAAVAGDAVAVPEAVVATPKPGGAAVYGDRLFRSASRHDVPRIRDIIWTLGSHDLRIRPDKFFGADDSDWIAAVIEKADAPNEPVELPQIPGQMLALSNNRLPAGGDHLAVMRSADLIEKSF